MKDCEGQMSLFDFIEQAQKVTPEYTASFANPIIRNGKPVFKLVDGKIVNHGDDKPICDFSKHVCNKQSVWEVADTLDDKDKCPHICCRKCEIRGCGARCNGSDEPKHMPKKIKHDCEECDVEWCSLICFERRGYQYDHIHRAWIRNEQGEILRKSYENRECKFGYDFTSDIAKDLKQHCLRWGYDWILRIIESPTVKTFISTVCNITNTYFFHIGEDTYGITYNKKNEIGTVYICGKFHEILLEDVKMESIISEISKMDVSDFYKKYDKEFLKFHISNMSEFQVEYLKDSSREEFIRKRSNGSGIMDIGDLTTGKRIIVADNLHHRPELPHASWDDYITMFKQVWEQESEKEAEK